MSNMPRKDTLRKYYRNSKLSDVELLDIAEWLTKYLDQEFVLPSNHTLKCLIYYEEDQQNRRNK